MAIVDCLFFGGIRSLNLKIKIKEVKNEILQQNLASDTAPNHM